VSTLFLGVGDRRGDLSRGTQRGSYNRWRGKSAICPVNFSGDLGFSGINQRCAYLEYVQVYPLTQVNRSYGGMKCGLCVLMEREGRHNRCGCDAERVRARCSCDVEGVRSHPCRKGDEQWICWILLFVSKR
jgi:hypothetical protein